MTSRTVDYVSILALFKMQFPKIVYGSQVLRSEIFYSINNKVVTKNARNLVEDNNCGWYVWYFLWYDQSQNLENETIYALTVVIVKPSKLSFGALIWFFKNIQEFMMRQNVKVHCKWIIA